MFREEVIEVEFNRKKVRTSKLLCKVPTRKLMQMHSEARASGYWYPPLGDGVTADEIKAVLAKREHIPNKKEGKAIRKEKIRSAEKERTRSRQVRSR